MRSLIIFRLILYLGLFIVALSFNSSATIELASFHPDLNIDIMNPFNRDYRIPEVVIEIDNTNPTVTIVKENILFRLKGCFREIYRDLKGTYESGVGLLSQNAYCEPECEYVYSNQELIGRYGEICDTNPRLFTDISYSNVIVQKEDAYEFHYTLWGGNWERRAQALKGQIILPVDTNEVDVYFRPPNSNIEYSVDGNTINFEAQNVKGPFEIILGFGRGQDIGMNGRNIIKQKETNYADWINKELTNANTFLVIVIFLVLVTPLAVFLKFGKEINSRKVSFSREVPKELKPYQVNLLSSGATGELTPDAISSTILDLARRGHIDIEEVKDTKGIVKKDIYLTFKKNESDKLTKPEIMIYNFFSSLAAGALSQNKSFAGSKAIGIIVSIFISFMALNFFFSLLFIISSILYNVTNSGVIAGIGALFFAVLFIYGMIKLIKEIMKYFGNLSPDEIVSRKPSQVKWSEMASRLRMDTSLSLELRKMEVELKKEVRTELGINKYFDSKGYQIAIGLLLIGLLISAWKVVTLSSVIDYRPIEFDYIIPFFGLLGVIALVLILLPNRVFGRFTKKGLETHNKIMAFRTFITDYSSLKKYPPSSIAIWDEIIVYATALGCANNVEKHMTKLVGKDNSSSISRAASIGMASSISSSVRSSSSSGGGGRGGGRAGGGGGGAR